MWNLSHLWSIVSRFEVGAMNLLSRNENESMTDDLLSRLGARRGHFRYESGHHGDLWLEIARLYLRPNQLRPFATELARGLAAHAIEAVCGPMIEGAFLAQMVAEELDIEFTFANQIIRSGTDTLFPVSYHIPESLRPLVAGKRIAIVDDVINAGSAVRGTYADLQACSARPVVMGSLLVLGTSASVFAANNGIALVSLGRHENSLWEPSTCPLCAADAPLEGVAS
jgi:orotate phosphoribosyltransferase